MAFEKIELRNFQQFVKPQKLPANDPRLFEVSLPVDINEITSPEFQQLCNFLESEMIENDGAGMSAPQYGVMQKIVVVDSSLINRNSNRDKDEIKPIILINPTMEIIDTTFQKNWEGCFSVVASNGDFFYTEVERPISIKVTALNRNGEHIELTLENFQAHIFQHEYDHFEGLRLFQRVQDDALFMVVPNAQLAEYRLLRRRGESWPHTCTKAEMAEKLGIPVEKTAFIAYQ